jgi:hypothetical protein
LRGLFIGAAPKTLILAVVAGFADALVALAVPAIVGHPDQPEVVADLAAIVEGAIEYFIDQPLPADRAGGG